MPGIFNAITVAEGVEFTLTNVVWTGTTAPSGTVITVGSWYQVGKRVFFDARLEYSIAGVGLTAVTFDFPSGAPAPKDFTGVGTSEIALTASGFLSILVGPAGANATRALFSKAASGYSCTLSAGANTFILGVYSLSYQTA